MNGAHFGIFRGPIPLLQVEGVKLAHASLQEIENADFSRAARFLVAFGIDVERRDHRKQRVARDGGASDAEKVSPGELGKGCSMIAGIMLHTPSLSDLARTVWDINS